VHVLGLEVTGEADDRRQGLDRRVLEDVTALADEHRHLVDADLEAIEQSLDARVGLDVLVDEGLSVAAEELSDGLGRAGVAGAEEHRVLRQLAHQREAPEDEGAHQNLAQLWVALHERP
jgi:hypothetical protein